MKLNIKDWNRRKFLTVTGGALAGTALLGKPSLLQAGPQYGGKTRLGFPFLPNGADPHRYTGLFAQVPWSFAYDGLVDLVSGDFIERWIKSGKPRGEMPQVVPNLAESWDISNKGKVYTFHLRKGVKFHNGNPLTAADVVWNFQRKMSKAIAAPTRVYYRDVTSVNALDEHTVQVTLKVANASFLATACQMTLPIIAKDSLPMKMQQKPPRSGWLIPPGTGPFTCSEYKTGRRMKFKKFTGFREKGLPYLDEVTIERIPDEMVRYTALRSGELDWAMNIPNAELASRSKGKPVFNTTFDAQNYKILVDDFNLMAALGMNQRIKPLDDIRVRKAIALALKRDEIAKFAFDGLGVAADQSYSERNSPFWIEDMPQWYERNTEESRKLLADAGFSKGLDLEINVATSNAQGRKAAQVIQQQLKVVGINLKINILDKAGYWPIRRKSRQQLQFDYIGNYFEYDLDSMATFFISPDKLPKKAAWRNGAGYANEEVDQLFTKARREMNFNKRLQMYRRIFEINKRDVVYIPLMKGVTGHAISSRVQNFDLKKSVPFYRGLRDMWLKG